MEHQTYQYFEYSRSHHPSHQERTRAKSAISIPRLRTCCECGAEECPACGRSSSPSKSNRPSYQEFFIPKQYSNPTKSTTHDSYRTYESQRDQDTLFSFPAGRPNPDETYFDKSINDTEPREKRKFSNIERYKAASPVMKRSLQSHISDILGYEDNDSREGSPRKEKYSKDIFAQGYPPGIYRADGGRTAASLSPQPKAKIPWQRITKQDLSPEKSPKRLVRMRSSPQKSGSMKRLEITQEMKWNEGKRDVSPNSLSRFQDKIKQASMLLKNSKTKYGDAEGNGYNEFTLQTYVDTKVSKGNGKFGTEHSTQEEESKGPNSQKKGNSKSSSKGEIESNVQGQGQVQGDSLMKDILRRYGNANRTKPGSLQQIKTLSRGNSVEGTQVKKKSSRDVGESSNGSILLMTEPEVVSQREEQLVRKMNENNARNLPATPFQTEQEGVQGRVNVQECVDGEGKQAARKKSPLVKASSQSAMGREIEEVQVQLNKKATSLKDSAFGGDKEGDFRSKNALIEPLNYREKRLERQNSERRQLTRDGSQASLKRERSIEALQTKEGLRKVSVSPYQAEQEQVVSAVGHVKPIFNGMPQEDVVESKQHIVKKPSLGKEDMSLLRGGSQEEFNQYQRPPTMKDISVDINIEQGLKRVNTVESVASNEKNLERQNSGNQQYAGKEGSHASLRKESSVEAFQMKRKGTGNSSSSNLSVTPFQTEQHDTLGSQQENPFLVQNNTPTKYGERSDLGQYSTESKPPISKKSSLVREGSRVSLVRESSVEEFNPDKKSSSGKETERDSKQEDTQVYHSTKRAVPQHHSLRKGGSYGSLASESSNQESVTKKKNSVRSLNTLPVNVNQEPFRTEPDQEESPRVDAGARKSNAMQYVAEMKSPLKGQGNSKEKSPLRKTYSMQEEQMVRESLHRVNSLRETSYAQEITRQPINTINAQNSGLGNTVALVQAPQVMSRDFNEEVSDKETKEKKPVRVNSWTSLQKNPSEPRGDEASNAEEVKVNVNVKNLASISVTDVEPAVPTAVVETRGYKPQEIEDIMRVDSYSVDKKEKDRYNNKAKVNPMMKNGGQESNLNESYSMDKSISYEFSFEENSYDRATHEKSTDYSKMVKDLTGSNLLSRQVSEGYSKPVLAEAAMNRYKAANNVVPKSGNNFLTDESQNQMQSSSPSEFHDRTSSFADMRTDVNQNKKEIDHSKVLRPKAIEVGRFNQPALENINSSKISFSMEPMSGMRVNDEYRKDCRVDYCEIKVVYKDDHRQSMLQNFLSGKMIPSSQGTTQGNMSARSRRDLFRYHK